MSKKLEQEAVTSLEKLDELVNDILENNTDGGDASFRQIVFSGLTQTKNQILLDKMQELLFRKEEKDLKKTIILGIFIHKEMFQPIIEYGISEINVDYIDETYDQKESYLFVLDALIELAYKDKLNNFDESIALLLQIFKIACCAKSTSVLADKLLQRFLNSRLGTISTLQNEFVSLIKDETTELNQVVIAINILARARFNGLLDIINEFLDKIIVSNADLAPLMPLLDVMTLSFGYYTEKKFFSKIKRLIKKFKEINLNSVNNQEDIAERIKTRIKKLQNDINSHN